MTDDLGRKIALRLHEGFGGHTRVMQYLDEENLHSVDVLRYESKLGDYIGTIGGYRYPLQRDVRSTADDIRVELISLVEHAYVTAMESAITSVYFEMIQRPVRLSPGSVVKDVLRPYDCNSLPHLYLTNPFFDGDFSSFKSGDVTIAFLMAFPISQGELEFLEEKGMTDFEEELETSGFDYSDIHRPSVISAR